MPKMKSKGGVKKRFQLTASGKIKRHKCNHSHLLTKKQTKRKRHLRQPDLVHPADEKRIRRMLLI